MKVYRTEEALFDDSLECQVLEEMLFAMIEGERVTFDELMEKCEDEKVREEVFDILVSLIDDKIICESAEGLQIINKMAAMHCAGFFTEDVIDQVPEGIRLLALSDNIEDMLNNNPTDDVIDYISELIGLKDLDDNDTS